MKILFFALPSGIALASSCAAFVRASGHKARAVDATLVTKADREAVDLVVTHAECEDIVRAAYDDKKLLVVTEFNPATYVPEHMAAIEAWVSGQTEEAPDVGHGEGAKKAAPLKVEEIRAALAEKGIAIPEGAKKAELQALLDAATASA